MLYYTLACVFFDPFLTIRFPAEDFADLLMNYACSGVFSPSCGMILFLFFLFAVHNWI